MKLKIYDCAFDFQQVKSFVVFLTGLFAFLLLMCEVYNVFWTIKPYPWTSLVAQWIRIRLPMQGTRVRALMQEGPTCRGATKPVHHNY